MLIRAILSVLLATATANGSEPPANPGADLSSGRVVVHLIDARLIAPRNADAPGDRNLRAGVTIGSRILTASESRKLRSLLAVELRGDELPPGRGHWPMHAIQFIDSDEAGSMVTLCRFSSTWQKDGSLHSVRGDKSVRYLEELLPLPDVFDGLHEVGQLHALGGNDAAPFHGLDADAPEALLPRGKIEEAQILRVAKEEVAAREKWANDAEYRISKKNNLWHVTVWRLPREHGGVRYIVIDGKGYVRKYSLGR